MERKDGRTGRLAVLLPPAFLALCLIVGAVVFGTVQEVLAADDCICDGCYFSSYGQVRITQAWKDGEGGCVDSLECRVVRWRCQAEQVCWYLGESCWAYPSGPCSYLICSLAY